MDFLTARDLALDGEVIFMFDGDRGISGDTVADPGAMVKDLRQSNSQQSKVVP